MFPVGSRVKIQDISNCAKVELNEEFEVLSSNSSTTVIKNKDGKNLGGYCSWRFAAVANATEDDWVELDEKIYADHILRENIDQCKSKIVRIVGWEKVSGLRNKKLSAYADMFTFRCKRSNLPVADATKSQVADPTKPQATNVVADDWVIIDKSIYGHLKIRERTDECNYKNTRWNPVVNPNFEYNYYKDYEFRCMRSDLPVTGVTKSQMADAAKPLEAEHPFSVGQNIICREKDLRHLTYNEMYTALEVYSIGIVHYVKVKDNSGVVSGFWARRFRTATPSEISKSQATNLCAEAAQSSSVQNKGAEMFQNKFEVGQKVLCEDTFNSKRITNGKNYVVISNDKNNNGSGMDMLEVINDNGKNEKYFVSRFSAAVTEVTHQPIVQKDTKMFSNKFQDG